MSQSAPDSTGAPPSSLLIFLSQWLRNPRSMASITPSGRQLGRMMAAAMPQETHRVVELGAGTGAITEALLRHGIRPENLLAVEMNPVLHDLLQQRFPHAHVARGDARHLDELVRGCASFHSNPADSVCSSLGLLTMPQELQHDIVAAAFRVLQPQGAFVQYTYGPRPPLHDEVRRRLGLEFRCAGLAWRNLPPARVYVYTRRG